MDSIAGARAPSDPDQHSTEVEDLRAQVARLEAQVLARDNLLAVAAHELRNPMHTMLLLITSALALARRDRTQELVPKLERIRHVVDVSVKRATLLLDSVRLEAKAWSVDRREFDLCEVVREICASHEPEAQFAGTVITLSLPQSLRGSWDRLAIEQVVANLVSNAIKYGQGSPIDISLHEVHGNAVLDVRDRGPGIAVQDQQRIFERFQQAIGTPGKRSGFGIGLWLVKSLVEAHDGSVSVHSRAGEGAMFSVSLPVTAP
jgi:signal transduction histidine kinase